MTVTHVPNTPSAPGVETIPHVLPAPPAALLPETAAGAPGATRTTTVRLLLALTLFSALVGVGLEMWTAYHTVSWIPREAGYAGTFGPGWSGAFNRLAYFTGQSNLLVALASALLLLHPRSRNALVQFLLLVALFDITITCVVYVGVLAGPNLGGHFPPEVIISTTLEHLVTPLLAWACWFLIGPTPVTWRRTALAMLVPLTWVVWTLVRGTVVDWYPYSFLDVPRLGLGEVLTNVTLLVPAVPVLGLTLMGIERLLGSRR